MSVVRSPNYPQMDLGEALSAVRPVYQEEHRNKMSRDVLASHLGYSSLNGRALAKIGAVRAYGLIEGTQDELRITPDAITLLEAPEEAPERADALARCALKPPIFKEIAAEYATPPSEQNLRFFLAKKGYTSDAAGKAGATYLATMRLVTEAGGRFPDAPQEAAVDQLGHQSPERTSSPSEASRAPSGVGPASVSQMQNLPGPGMRQAVFTLEDGDVFLSFPATLSAEGYEELSEYLAIFLKRAQRQKRQQEATDDSI